MKRRILRIALIFLLLCAFATSVFASVLSSGCIADADCKGVKKYCAAEARTCVECAQDGHCTGGKVCDLHSKKCTSGCLTDSHCSGGLVCLTTTRACVQCFSNTHCGAGRHCEKFVCQDAPASREEKDVVRNIFAHGLAVADASSGRIIDDTWVPRGSKDLQIKDERGRPLLEFTGDFSRVDFDALRVKRTKGGFFIMNPSEVAATHTSYVYTLQPLKLCKSGACVYFRHSDLLTSGPATTGWGQRVTAITDGYMIEPAEASTTLGHDALKVILQNKAAGQTIQQGNYPFEAVLSKTGAISRTARFAQAPSGNFQASFSNLASGEYIVFIKTPGYSIPVIHDDIVEYAFVTKTVVVQGDTQIVVEVETEPETSCTDSDASDPRKKGTVRVTLNNGKSDPYKETGRATIQEYTDECDGTSVNEFACKIVQGGRNDVLYEKENQPCPRRFLRGRQCIDGHCP